MSTQTPRTPGTPQAPQRDETHRDDAPSASQEPATLVAQGSDVPEMAKDIIEVEKSAAREDLATPHEKSEMSAWLYQPEAEPREVAKDELPSLIADDRNFVWVDLSSYAPADLDRLAELLGVHRTGVRGALSSWKRPRLQLYADHFYVTATIPELDPHRHLVTARQLDLFVGRNFVLSAHKHPLPMREHILARAKSSPDLLEQDSACMLYIILDELLGCYEQAHEQIQQEIEQMEERALKDTSDAYLGDLLRFKRYVFALSQLADQHRIVFSTFLRPDFPWVTEEDIRENYRDLEQHLLYLSDTIHGDKDAVNSAFDIYVSHNSHRTNNVMKLLTIVSTILLPASVLFGFFGVNNIQNIPVLTSVAGFAIMVILVLVISGGSLLLFHRRGWL